LLGPQLFQPCYGPVGIVKSSIKVKKEHDSAAFIEKRKKEQLETDQSTWLLETIPQLPSFFQFLFL